MKPALAGVKFDELEQLLDAVNEFAPGCPGFGLFSLNRRLSPTFTFYSGNIHIVSRCEVSDDLHVSISFFKYSSEERYQ
jgi:hypothetical protein